MNIVVDVPSNLPDAVQCTPLEFSREAKLAT